jgi:uncharacterized protein (TIGR00369 family)
MLPPVPANLAAVVERVMLATPFMQHLGVKIDRMAIGQLHTRMTLRPELLQQHGFAHAGIIASLADHTAGSCACTHGSVENGAEQRTSVLSIEFKINMLAPAKAAALLCRSTTLRAGAKVAVVESEIFSAAADTDWSNVDASMLCAKATVTLSMR